VCNRKLFRGKGVMGLLEGKVAVVTGASRGIGRSIAVEYAKQGASLVINASSDSSDLHETANIVRNLGKECEIVVGSVSELNTARNLIARAEKQFGRLDVLINNAGITKDVPLLLMNENDFDDVISVNLRGVYQCSREAARVMMKQKFGRIISISSVSALSGRPGQCNYAAAKSGVIGFTKSLARELGKYNVLVNALFVGAIDTKMTKSLSPQTKKEMIKNISLNRIGKPEEVAGPCVFLGSELSDFVTGTTINVSGGGYV